MAKLSPGPSISGGPRIVLSVGPNCSATQVCLCLFGLAVKHVTPLCDHVTVCSSSIFTAPDRANACKVLGANGTLQEVSHSMIFMNNEVAVTIYTCPQFPDRGHAVYSTQCPGDRQYHVYYNGSQTIKGGTTK